ncbi:MAG: hypothetical protein HUU60_06525, partial [Armatimonadetes bacterium]|nr:hypothetical protein [Armatimonadota bacterium]
MQRSFIPLFIFLCAEALAQAGSWSFLSPALEGEETPARWRRVYFRPNVPPGSGMTTDYDVAPPYPNRPLFYDMAESQTYGIHAVVAPQTWQASGQTVPRGSVLLWGVGVNPTWNDGVARPNYTPLLLWSGDSIFETARRRYGYVTFCPDPIPSLTDFLNDGNIFCSGHANLPDGKLFVAGGQQKDTDNSIHGIRAAFTWTAAGWASGASYGWSGILGGPGDGYPGVGMIEKRWYPTPTVLPSGQVQIVGGLQTTNPSNETKTFETYDPVQNRFQFANLPPSQIEHLGNEYPRILLVSLPKPDGCATARSVYV